MVWIYGGAFINGQAGFMAAGPHYLIESGVMVVTLNYRVGSFGNYIIMNLKYNFSKRIEFG